MEFSSLEATESAKKKKAHDRLLERVKVGATHQEAAIRKALGTVIVDRIWYPNKVHFINTPDITAGNDDALSAWYDADPGKSLTIHNHALGQMADVMEIARNYVTKLRSSPLEWKRELLIHNLNEHFQKEKFVTAKGQPIGYLRRAVGDQIRGFQGRSFGRNMATAPLLRTFVEQCAKYRAGPIEASTSDLMTTLKCVLPYIFEPVAGEFIAFGAAFSNSDFGMGKLSVSGLVLRISSGTTSITENALSKVHLGKVIDSEEEFTLSEATMNKELETHQGAVTDIMAKVLSPMSVKQTLELIALAHSHKIEWFKLSSQLSKVLSKKELELVKSLLDQGDDLMDLPSVQSKPGEDRVATRWWAANVVGWIATKEESTERRKDLQELAGGMLK